MVYSVIERKKPHVICQIGDLYDFYSASHFPATRNMMTPKHELEEGLQGAKTMWETIRRIAPQASCYQIKGNHDIRPIKRVLELIPALEHFFSIDDVFKFHGVDTVLDDKEELLIDGIVYEHGFYSQPGRHCRENMRPTVMGHTHRGWTHFESIRNHLLWELNVGYLADPKSVALSYGRKRWTKWTTGYGWIDGSGPRFCPL